MSVPINFLAHDLINQQIFEDQRRRKQLEPERALMLAILEDAIDSLEYQARKKGKYHQAGTGEGARARLKDETIEWFKSDDESWAFSYVNVMIGLGLDAGYWRRRIFESYGIK